MQKRVYTLFKAKFLRFLELYSGHRGRAINESGISAYYVAMWRKDDPEFKKEYDRIRSERKLIGL